MGWGFQIFGAIAFTFGFAPLVLWLALKLFTNRNEDRCCDLSDADCFQASTINHEHGDTL